MEAVAGISPTWQQWQTTDCRHSTPFASYNFFSVYLMMERGWMPTDFLSQVSADLKAVIFLSLVYTYHTVAGQKWR
jgi:hypothetical protein